MNRRIAQLWSTAKGGRPLPQPFYTAPEIYEHDLRHVFLRNWVFAGPAGRIPQPGDYFTVELGRESVIVIRSDDGSIHAVANVCRHRGSRICTAAAGRARTLVCPYHQWVYAPSGALLNARLMDAGFDLSDHGLTCYPVEIVEGLVFFSMTMEPPPFEPFASAVAPRLKDHRLAQARVAHTARYQIRANWKLVLENSRECYHCGGGHPQYTRAVGFAAAIGSNDAQAYREREVERLETLQRLGILTSEIPFASESDWYHYRRFFFRPGMRTESMDGKPVAPLMTSIGGWEAGAFALVALPSLLLEASPDYVMTLQMLPAGPALTNAEITWLVHGEAQPETDFDIQRLTEFWRVTSEQDWELCELNQRGVESAAYRPGPYAPSEAGVERFLAWYRRQSEVGQAAAGGVEEQWSLHGQG